MTQFLLQKKELLHQVYEKAQKNTTERSFSGVLKYLERTLLDDFKISLSYKTFETYYRKIVENGEDYNIKPAILEDLSKYLGYQTFNEFCEKNPIKNAATNVTVSIDGNEHSSVSKSFSEIIINITNSPIFSIPEFVSKNSQSFGILGILLLGGFFANKNGYFSKNLVNEKQDSVLIPEVKNNVVNTPQTIMYILKNETLKPEQIIINERKKDCIFWKNDHYERIFCDEKISGENIIVANEEKITLKKILLPDTLTIENSLGKVWYNKKDKKVEFFTHYGIHPTNGKTLKPVTKHILETYVH